MMRPSSNKSVRITALSIMAVMFVLLARHLYLENHPGAGDGLAIKHRYLLVEVVGAPDWEKEHTFSVRWRGKDLPLPVVFRVPGVADFKMGSAGEIFGYLEIGDEQAPVSARPDTKFQTRNTGAFALIAEKRSFWGTASFSIANSVFISPPEHPGDLSPLAGNSEWETAGNRLEKRIGEVIAMGNVIDVEAPKPRAIP